MRQHYNYIKLTGATVLMTQNIYMNKEQIKQESDKKSISDKDMSIRAHILRIKSKTQLIIKIKGLNLMREENQSADKWETAEWCVCV